MNPRNLVDTPDTSSVRTGLRRTEADAPHPDRAAEPSRVSGSNKPSHGSLRGVFEATSGAQQDASSQQQRRSEGSSIKHRHINVEDIEIFYREAGSKDAPSILLLHGFPASSHEFRHLIPMLADEFHVVAPDLPGFGFSAFPDANRFRYTFDGFAELVDQFRTELSLERFALYVHDYGAHVGFRLALRDPERITAIACQNAEAYRHGFNHEPLLAYWRDPSPEHLDKLREILTEQGTRQEFVGGLPEWQVELVSPEMWALHWPLLARPGNIDMQLRLFADYESNFDVQPQIHAYFRKYQPPALILWGRHEIYYSIEAAEAYRRDLPKAEIHILDAGHWALETHTRQIGELVKEFFRRQLLQSAGHAASADGKSPAFSTSRRGS